MSPCGKLGHIKAVCRSNSTQKSHKKMDGHKKHFIKDRRVHQMSAQNRMSAAVTAVTTTSGVMGYIL